MGYQCLIVSLFSASDSDFVYILKCRRAIRVCVCVCVAQKNKMTKTWLELVTIVNVFVLGSALHCIYSFQSLVLMLNQ